MVAGLRRWQTGAPVAGAKRGRGYASRRQPPDQVSERIEITGPRTSSRIVAVEGDTLLLGSGTGVDVREQAPGESDGSVK